jgi:hypothetical protein
MTNQPFGEWRLSQFREKMKGLRAEARTSKERKRELAKLLPALWTEGQEVHRSSLIAL